MTKREASLRKRLSDAHRFIESLRRSAKDYGSQFSSDVYYSCDGFLRNNRPVAEPKMTLVPTKKWLALRRQAIRAKLIQP